MKKNWQVFKLDDAGWDKVIAGFKNIDIYYMKEYVKAFWINGDGEPELFYYSNGKTKAINLVMKRDIAEMECFKGIIDKQKWFDLSTPYGYGGFLIEGDDTKEVQEAYLEYCIGNHIVSEFVRFHPILKNWEKMDDFYETVYLGSTVVIDTNQREEIWNNLTSKNRNMVRKAIKSGIKVYWTRCPRIIEPFMEIYNKTMEMDKAEEYYYFPRVFYESILADLKYNALWFYAELEGKFIASAVFLLKNGTMHYHLSASRKEYQHMAPMNLLLYEAAVWACENSYSKLHLGGGLGAGTDTLYKFKKSFNRKQDYEFWIGKKIYNVDIYNQFVDIRKKTEQEFDEEERYFPKYRS